MNKINIYTGGKIYLILIWVLTLLPSCSDDFLDAKPSSRMVVPTTLEDCQKLMDDFAITYNCPVSGEISSDEYYVEYTTWQSNSRINERNSYIWADDIYEGQTDLDEWNDSFQVIYTCNAVLDVLEKITVTDANKNMYENIKGNALYYRAYRYFLLSEVFTMPYDTSNAENTLGLPLRSTPNIDYTVQRSNLKDTFAFILEDLNLAKMLVNNDAPDSKLNHASKSAVFGLLAKIYLVMGDFQNALENAEQSLTYYSVLMDYNNIPYQSANPFLVNPELIQTGLTFPSPYLYPLPLSKVAYVSEDVYSLFDDSDIRKEAFFVKDEFVHRKYLYSENGMYFQIFPGLATDEIYLIKAECLARENQLEESMKTLDKLLLKRHFKGTYSESHANSADEALSIILNERRKELVFRGARWSDVRRLNVLGANITMQRELNDKIYSIEPNSPKYAVPIPNNEIQLSGLEQNPR